MQSKAQIDQALRQKAETKEIPAWSRWPPAAMRSSIRRVRQTRPLQGRRHDRGQRVLDRVHDQGRHRGRRHAAGGTGQAVAGGTIGTVLPDLASPQVLEVLTPMATRNCGPAGTRSRCGI